MTAQLTLPQSSSSQSGMALFEKIEFYLLAIGFSTFIYFPSIISFTSCILIIARIILCKKYGKKIIPCQVKNICYLIFFLMAFKIFSLFYHNPGKSLFIGWDSYFQIIIRQSNSKLNLLLLYFILTPTFYQHRKTITYCLVFSYLPVLVLFTVNTLYPTSLHFFSQFITYYPNGFATAFFHVKNARAILVTISFVLSFSLVLHENKIKHLACLFLIILLSGFLLYHSACRASVIGLVVGMTLLLYFYMMNNEIQNLNIKKLVIFLISMMLVLMIAVSVLVKRQAGVVHHLMSWVSPKSIAVNPQVAKRKKIVIEKIKQQAKQQSLQSGLNQQAILNNIAKSHGFNAWQDIENIPTNIVDPAKNVRLLFYNYAFHSILKKPLFGNGLDTFQDNLKASHYYQKCNWISKNLFEREGNIETENVPHNYYLNIAYCYGLFFLVFQLQVFIFALMYNYRDYSKVIYFPILTIIMVCIFTDPFLIYKQGIILTTFILAIMTKSRFRESKNDEMLLALKVKKN